MSDIFFSWASADETIVTGLLNRLRDLGLDSSGDDPLLPHLWEYRDHTGVGNIASQVREAIESSDVTILCLSDESLARPWIVSEATWAFAPRPQGTRIVLPVQVGAMSADSLKRIAHVAPVSPADLIADVSTGAEEELRKLCNHLFKTLKRPDGIELVPKLLPIAVLAMTEDQAKDIFETWLADYKGGNTSPIWDVCRELGMTNPPELFETLRTRYGKRAEDVMPFGSGETLAQIVSAGLRDANRGRVRNGKRPIFSRWLHGELTGADEVLRQRARQLWKSRDSVLVIDSVSAHHPIIRSQLSVPQPLQPERAAIVYLPPYSQHTGQLAGHLRNVIPAGTEALGLGDWFDEWYESPTDRMISFDTSTAVALRLWLNRKFRDVPTENDPAIPSKRDSLGQGSYKGRLKQV